MLPFIEQDKWLKKQLAYQAEQRKKLAKFTENTNE
jgi:hypothetical protein